MEARSVFKVHEFDLHMEGIKLFFTTESLILAQDER